MKARSGVGQTAQRPGYLNRDRQLRGQRCGNLVSAADSGNGVRATVMDAATGGKDGRAVAAGDCGAGQSRLVGQQYDLVEAFLGQLFWYFR